MHNRRDLGFASLTILIAVVVLTAVPSRPAEIIAGIVLFGALFVLARSAIRLAGRPTPRGPSARPRQD